MPEKDNHSLQIEKQVANALKVWHAPVGRSDNLLSDLLIVQQAQKAYTAIDDVAAQRLATNQVLMNGIEALELQDRELAQVLQLRFVDKQKLWAVANTMAISEQTVSRLQKKGLHQLALIIETREAAQRIQHAQQMEAMLPPASYTTLFGVEQAEQALLDLLEDEDGPPVIVVTGLGGIGKTALTDKTVRTLIHRFQFHYVLWVRIEHQSLDGNGRNPELTFENLLSQLVAQLWPDLSEQLTPLQRLTKLRQAFTTLPYLVVIDNIEDQTDSAYILDQLHSLARPTKFLLTSRTQLTKQTAVFNFKLQELSQIDAIAFVRYHAQECGTNTVTAATDEDIAQIYGLTGGNPLALKLVVSLLDVLPLSEILVDLTATRTDSIEGMYRHIYQKSWQALTDNGRILLQAMPLVSESGGTPDYLATVSGLPKANLWSALHELHNRSLIEVRGSIHEKRYGIHRLTHSFLCTVIIKMPDL